MQVYATMVQWINSLWFRVLQLSGIPIYPETIRLLVFSKRISGSDLGEGGGGGGRRRREQGEVEEGGGEVEEGGGGRRGRERGRRGRGRRDRREMRGRSTDKASLVHTS